MDPMSLLHTVSDRTQKPSGEPNSGTSESPRDHGRTDPPTPPDQQSAGAGGSLTRVTANFTPRAMNALERVTNKTGDSKTDVLNRSVMIYETFLELVERSNGTLRDQYPDGSEETLRFIG
jgi:hypothetical protein